MQHACNGQGAGLDELTALWPHIPQPVRASLLSMARDAVAAQPLARRLCPASTLARGIESIPLYPEERACRAPTADKILGLFEPLRRNRLFEKGRLLKTFWDPLSSAQRTVLDLLEVPTTAYGQ